MSDPTRLGTVDAVNGGTVTVRLDGAKVSGLSFVDGYGYKVGQVGSFVRLPVGYTDLYGLVLSVGASIDGHYGMDAASAGRRWLSIQLVGESSRHGEFERGVSQFPNVGDDVFLVGEADLKRLYGRPSDGRYVSVGRVASADSIPALVDINKLVTRHSAVLGTTGAGKSTTVAGLIGRLADVERYPSARVLLLDVHGEYSRAFRGRASVFRVGADVARGERELVVPYWALDFDELLSLTLGSLDDSDRGFIRQRVDELKLASVKINNINGIGDDAITVDTPLPFSIHALWLALHKMVYATYTVQGSAQSESTAAYELDGEGKAIELGHSLKVVAPRYRAHTLAAGADKVFLPHGSLNIKRQVDALGSRLRDKRYDFLFRPGEFLPDAEGRVHADLDQLIESWLGGPEPVTILDLSGIPSGVLSHLVGALLRIVYDCLFWARSVPEGGRLRPLLVVLEEAHVFLSDHAGRAASSIRRLVKEGRKHGIGAMIVSQRPSEIDPTVLSQCGTIFAMRLTNSTDRAHVSSSVVHGLDGLLSTLPSLRTGEAIVVGEAVHLPMRALIDLPAAGRRPDSGDPVVYAGDDSPGGWNNQRSPANYTNVTAMWRAQSARMNGVTTDMNRTPVSSTTLVEVGYDNAAQTLEVVFVDGSVYRYYDVPQASHEALIGASSVGQYFNQAIKNAYRYSKM